MRCSSAVPDDHIFPCQRLRISHWALIHWPPDSSELFRCDGAIAVFIKERGSFPDFSSAFFSQLLAMVWARLRKTDRGGGCPSAGTLTSWSSLQCHQCAGCAEHQSPPVPPPDRITFACVLSPRSDQASWSDTGLHPGHNRKPWPLILMAVSRWRIICNIGKSELLTGLVLEYLPCVRLNLSKLCCTLNASPVFSF